MMVKRFQVWAKILNYIVFILGWGVLWGWMFDIELLKRSLPHAVGMNPATAVSFILSSVSLYLLTAKSNFFQKQLTAQVLACVVLFIGTLVFCGVIFNFDPQIDHLLFPEKLKDPVLLLPNRMAPNTAFCFILIGTALLLLPLKNAGKRHTAHFISVITAFTALLTLLGYLYHVKALTDITSYIPMAINTAFGFLFFSFAILFAYPYTGIMKAFSSSLQGSITARKFLPVAILIPIVLGFLRIRTTMANLVAPELGTTVIILCMITIFLIYVYNNAVSLNKKDMQRIKAEENLKENEEYLKTILNTIGDGVIVADKNGKLVLYNPAAKNIMGPRIIDYKPEKWSAQYGIFYPDTHTIYPPEQLPLAKAIKGEDSGEVELFIRNPHQTEGAYVSVSAKQLKTNNKNIGAVAIFHDITERRKTEVALKDLYDNAPAGYYSLNTNGDFINANNTTLHWLGYNKEELMGRSITEVLTEESKQVFFNAFPIAKKQGFIKDIEFEFKRKNGSIFLALVNSSAVKNEAGEFLYSRTTIFDITERKKLEEDLKRTNIFLDTILENIPDMIFVKDAAELRFVLFNKAGEELIGLPKNEMIGKNDYDLFTPEKADYFTQTDKDVLANGVLLDIKEEVIQTHNGDRWLHTQKIPIVDETGVPLYLLGISEDITVQKKTAAALHEFNERFLRLFYASPLAMVIRSIADGKILDVNEEYERLLGYKKEELVGQTSVGMGMILNREFSDQLCRDSNDKRSLKNIEATLLNAKKEPVSVLVSIEKMKLGNTDCILSALLDITERKKTEEQLKELNKELESFTYSVSHDLRAPLRIINGYAELISTENNETLNDDAKRMLGNILANSRRMGQLIDDLLNFSRLGRRESVTHQTDMNALVSNVIDEQQDITPKYKIKIDDLPVCYCDSSLMKQVWQNLISNAVKYSSKNDRPVIEIGSKQDENKLIYFIKDNGSGFDMKYYDKLFGVFQRLHNSSDYEGTGVGLALVQRIIKKHNGEIWAESKVNEGTTFYFTVCKS